MIWTTSEIKKLVKNLCNKQRFGLFCLFGKYRPVKNWYFKKYLATISRDLLKMKEKNWCTIHWQGILLRLKRQNLENKNCLATISRDFWKMSEWNKKNGCHTIRRQGIQLRPKKPQCPPWSKSGRHWNPCWEHTPLVQDSA